MVRRASRAAPVPEALFDISFGLAWVIQRPELAAAGENLFAVLMPVARCLTFSELAEYGVLLP